MQSNVASDAVDLNSLEICSLVSGHSSIAIVRLA